MRSAPSFKISPEASCFTTAFTRLSFVALFATGCSGVLGIESARLDEWDVCQPSDISQCQATSEGQPYGWAELTTAEDVDNKIDDWSDQCDACWDGCPETEKSSLIYCVSNLQEPSQSQTWLVPCGDLLQDRTVWANELKSKPFPMMCGLIDIP